VSDEASARSSVVGSNATLGLLNGSGVSDDDALVIDEDTPLLDEIITDEPMMSVNEQISSNEKKSKVGDANVLDVVDPEGNLSAMEEEPARSLGEDASPSSFSSLEKVSVWDSGANGNSKADQTTIVMNSDENAMEGS
jgi:hypothetical protein